MQNPDRIRLSLDRAIKFIENNKNSDGLWSDFLTLAGESIYWVSSYIGYSLALSNNSSVLESAILKDKLKDIGYNLLSNQCEYGGWGYGPGVPGDADSTSWCILFLSRLRELNKEYQDEYLEKCLEERLEKALSFLLIHQNQSDGGFRTYALPYEVSRYMGLNQSVSFEGWLSSQVCVTAVATKALLQAHAAQGAAEALNFIQNSQDKEGFWEPYWWSERLYATFNCMSILKAGKYRDYIDRISKAQNWINDTQLKNGGWGNSISPEGTPFSTALALRGLMLENHPKFWDNIEKGIEYLLVHQLADGGWMPAHILRIPLPFIKEPWKQCQSVWIRDGKAINAVIKDHKRLFTTATVISAFTEFENMRSSGGIY